MYQEQGASGTDLVTGLHNEWFCLQDHGEMECVTVGSIALLIWRSDYRVRGELHILVMKEVKGSSFHS